MSINKPDLTRVFASTALPANVVDPDTQQPGKVNAGWTAQEKPPVEWFNFLQLWFSQGLAHNNEQGVNVWDAETPYPIHAIAKGSDGKLYTCTEAGAGNDPVTSSKWFGAELAYIATALNAQPSSVIYETNTVTAIPDFIRNDANKATYSVPAAAQGKFILSVVDDALLTTDGGTYKMTPSVQLEFSSVSEMQSYASHQIGSRCSTGATKWEVNASKGISLLGGLFAQPLNGVWVNDYGLDVTASASVNAQALRDALSVGGSIKIQADIDGDEFNVDNDLPIYITKNDTTLSSNLAKIKRTNDQLPIIQAIGTTTTALKNIKIKGIHWIADSSAVPNVTTGDSANGAFRAAFVHGFEFSGNTLSNITAGVVCADSAADNVNWQAHITTIWKTVTDDQISRDVHIINNIGDDQSTYDRDVDVAGNVHSIVIGLCRDFETSGNIMRGYKAGHFTCGGQANNPAGASYLPTSGFELDDDDAFKAHSGLVDNNIFDVTNVGMWTWTARDIMHSNNIIKNATREVTDAESSRGVSFIDNKLLMCQGTLLNTFYDNADIKFTDNEGTIDLSNGTGDVLLSSFNDTNTATSSFGKLTISRNKIKVVGTSATRTVASIQPAAADHLVIEDNEFENVALLSFGGFKYIDVNRNDWIVDRAIVFGSAIAQWVNFGGTVTRSGLVSTEGRVSIKGNKFYARGAARNLRPAIGLGFCGSDTTWNIRENEMEGFQFFYNANTAVVSEWASSGVRVSINCQDNTIDQLQPQPALIQDSGNVLTDATCVSAWINNKKASGLDCYPTFPASSPQGMRFSVGSTFTQTPAAGGREGWICVSSGWQTNAVLKETGSISL